MIVLLLTIGILTFVSKYIGWVEDVYLYAFLYVKNFWQKSFFFTFSHDTLIVLGRTYYVFITDI